jgi:hypothetical protein
LYCNDGDDFKKGGYDMNEMQITVRGHSDDIICVEAHSEGKRVWVEEFSGWDNETPTPRHLGFSDGTLLSVCYTEEGVWRVTPLKLGKAKYNKVQEGIADGEYSDIVTLDLATYFSWVLFGGKDKPNIKTFTVP